MIGKSASPAATLTGKGDNKREDRSPMTGGTSAVWAGSGGEPPASATEHGSGAGTACQDWPLVSALPPLAAFPTAPAFAPGPVRPAAPEWGLSELPDAAHVVADEL